MRTLVETRPDGSLATISGSFEIRSATTAAGDDSTIIDAAKGFSLVLRGLRFLDVETIPALRLI